MIDGEKISVIVPVYNVEKYLQKCLDSIIGQTYRNLEIILVNDGATDSSKEICERYVLNDSRVQLITQKNQGLSAARNTGFAASSGEYVIFIDSDDYIADTMLEVLKNNIVKYDADMATCGICNVFQNYEEVLCREKKIYACDNIEAYKEILIGERVPGSICCKLLKRDSIKEIGFPVNRHYEDAFYHIELMQRIKKVCIDTEPLYYYVHRSESITTSKYQKASFDIVKAYEKNLRMICSKMPEIEQEGKFKLFWAYFVVLDRMLCLKDYQTIEEYKETVVYLKRHIKEICRCPYFTKNRKIGAIALKVNIRLYRGLMMLEHRRKMENT